MVNIIRGWNVFNPIPVNVLTKFQFIQMGFGFSPLQIAGLAHHTSSGSLGSARVFQDAFLFFSTRKDLDCSRCFLMHQLINSILHFDVF